MVVSMGGLSTKRLRLKGNVKKLQIQKHTQSLKSKNDEPDYLSDSPPPTPILMKKSRKRVLLEEEEEEEVRAEEKVGIRKRAKLIRKLKDDFALVVVKVSIRKRARLIRKLKDDFDILTLS